MDIHVKTCGYGYGWEISYPRQAWLLELSISIIEFGLMAK